MEAEGMPSPLHIFDGHKPENVLVNNAEIYDPEIILSELKANNIGRLIIWQININFLAKKFEFLVSLFKDKVDIIVISETKVDETFPISQLSIEGYTKPLSRGGGLIFYIRDDIHVRKLNHIVYLKVLKVFSGK